jgi:N-acetylmuramoyl-L-alanine amidase
MTSPAPAGAEIKKPAETKSAPEVAKAVPENRPEVKPALPAPAPAVKNTEPESETSDSLLLAKLDPPELKTSKPTTAPTFESVAPRNTLPRVKRPAAAPAGVHAARPTADGERSLTRALGLKIGRIVVDAGHGGHDTGTIGPGGLQEKDLTLDVALRLGKLLETKLGAEVIYTRTDDTFIPLETRTAIANQNQADLFISVHANSSRDSTARGVETFYLNFTSSPDALEVAARENAVSEKSIHELQDLVKKIALKEKIEESREFASEVQRSLWNGLSVKSPALRNRGVKKAPFIVLIGANMPSVLAEISFLSNPTDERRLQTPEYRQKVAEYLYRGITGYVNGLSGLKVAQNNPQQ